MSKTKFGYTVNVCNMPGNIIEYGEFTLIKLESIEDRPDYFLWKVSEYERLYEESELYETFEQAKIEAEKQIAYCINALEEDIADYRAIVLTDPRIEGV